MSSTTSGSTDPDQNTPQILRRCFQIGILGYLMLFALSLLFYLERTVFIDIAYHLFHIIKDDSVAIQNYRFGSAITQVFPLLATQLKLPLDSVLQIYSGCFILVYFLCYLVIGVGLKDYKLALVLLFVNTLFVTGTFYWIQSELPQGLAISILFLAWFRRQKTLSAGVVIISLAGLVTIAFFHPLLLFVFSFILIYFLLQKPQVVNKRLWITSFAFYFAAFLVKKYVFSTEYDNSAMDGAKQAFLTLDIPWNSYANKQFLHHLTERFYWIPVFGLLIATTFVIRKAWTKLGLFAAYFFCYLLLVNVSYQGPETKDYYIENLYLPLGVFLAIPVIFDVLPFNHARRWIPYTLVVAVLVTAGLRIYRSSEPYTARLEWMRSFLQAHQNEKLLVDPHSVPLDTLMMVWGTPYEFWLLSTIENRKTASIIIHEQPESVDWALGERKGFITTWGVFPYEELKAPYFHFTDTTSGYRLYKP